MGIANAAKIRGFMSEYELRWLAKMASRSKVIIEVGCFHGRTTRCLADNSDENAKIYAIDPWPGAIFDEYGKIALNSGTYVLEQFCENLNGYINCGKVIPVRTKFQDWETNIKADFIFIDGDHLHDAFEADIKKALSLISEDGVIAGHDYGNSSWPAVKKLTNQYFPEVQNTEGLIWSNRRF